jgi:WD40 repeat protein
MQNSFNNNGNKTLTLCHYCSLESFFSIIISKRLWLTDSEYTNDRYETKWLDEIVYNIFENLKSTNASQIEKIKKLEEQYKRVKPKKHYLLSFSLLGDMLSQWRGYGDDGKGIAIEFSSSHKKTNLLFKTYGVYHDKVEATLETDSTCFGFEEVEYKIEHTIQNIIEKTLNNDRNYEFNAILIKELSTRAKHFTFQEEQEVRLTYTPDNCTNLDGDIKNLRYRVNDNQLIPYYEYDFSRNAQFIEKVILGPHSNVNPSELSNFLDLNGFGHVDVELSKSAYRYKDLKLPLEEVNTKDYKSNASSDEEQIKIADFLKEQRDNQGAYQHRKIQKPVVISKDVIGITSFCLNNTGSRFCVSGTKETLIIWDCHRGGDVQLPVNLFLGDDNYEFSSASFAPDDSFMYFLHTEVFARDALCEFFIYRLNAVSLEVNEIFNGMDCGVNLTIAPDGHNLFEFNQDGRGEGITLFNIATHEFEPFVELKKIKGFTLSPSGKALCAWNSEDKIEIHDLDTSDVLKIRKSTSDYDRRVTSMAFLPDEAMCIIGDGDGMIMLLDRYTGEKLGNHEQQESPVTSLKITADGSALCSGLGNGLIIFWDLNTREKIGCFNCNGGSVVSLNFTQDGLILYAAHENGIVSVWSMKSLKQIAEMVILKDNQWVLTGPDGTYDCSSKARDYIEANDESYSRAHHKQGLLSEIMSSVHH